MLFRKFQLEWQYGLSELIIVVAGVMIALAADGWIEDRANRGLEHQYIAELINDLRSDTASLGYAILLAETRAGYGHTVLDAMDGKVEVSPNDLAVAVELSTWFTGPAYSKSTITDLVSTGNLRLIRNNALRRFVSEYYEAIEFQLQWAAYEQKTQNDLVFYLPDLLDLSHREAIVSSGAVSGGAGRVPWAPSELVVSEAEGEEILNRLGRNRAMRPRLEDMIRIQGIAYTRLTNILGLAIGALDMLRQELDSG